MSASERDSTAGDAVGDAVDGAVEDGAVDGVTSEEHEALDVLFAMLSPSSALSSVSFIIRQANADMAVCDLFDGSSALLARSEWVDSLRWAPGVTGHGVLISDDPKSLSVRRPELVELLMAGLVPEVRDGTVLVKGVARLPGVRSKVAVASSDPAVDAVAACVGRKANRVLALSGMLGGERVDVVPWSADQEEMLVAALAPAKVSRVVLARGRASVFVPAHRMAATVGAGGLNAQLAGRLAGCRVQVFVDSGEVHEES